MRDAVIVDVVRTPAGKGKSGGALAEVRPADLLAGVLHELVRRTGIEPELIDEVIGGCVTQAGVQAANITRSAVLAAGFPVSVPATTVDRQCGSSQQALHFAAHTVVAGAADVVIACGVESMSQAPLWSSSGDADPYGPGARHRARSQGDDSGRIQCRGTGPAAAVLCRRPRARPVPGDRLVCYGGQLLSADRRCERCAHHEQREGRVTGHATEGQSPQYCRGRGRSRADVDGRDTGDLPDPETIRLGPAGHRRVRGERGIRLRTSGMATRVRCARRSLEPPWWCCRARPPTGCLRRSDHQSVEIFWSRDHSEPSLVLDTEEVPQFVAGLIATVMPGDLTAEGED